MSEYQRGITVTEHNEGLRAASVLRIALRSFREATELRPSINELELTASIRQDMERAAEKARSHVRAEREAAASEEALAHAEPVHASV
jgi:hypothetical protein